MQGNKKNILKNDQIKDTGFMLPENYFSEFENNFKAKNNSLNSGFNIPKNYFETVENTILNKVKKSGFKTSVNNFQNLIRNRISGNKESKVIRFIKQSHIKMVGFSIAASILILIGLNNYKIKKELINFETLEITEIESWIDNDLISFSSFDIADTFGDINLTSETTYSEDEIIDYLDGVYIEDIIIKN